VVRRVFDRTGGPSRTGAIRELRGVDRIEGVAETAVYNGGSPWADYWSQTITELRGDLVESGKLTDALIDAFLTFCADSSWWTQTIAFTAIKGRAPAEHG
jgi:hypothetical protein